MPSCCQWQAKYTYISNVYLPGAPHWSFFPQKLLQQGMESRHDFLISSGCKRSVMRVCLHGQNSTFFGRKMHESHDPGWQSCKQEWLPQSSVLQYRRIF